MDGGSGNGQWWHNEQRDGEAIAMGDGMAVAQWMAQWAADDRRACRSGTMGGDARWMAAVTMMDSSGVIAMDGGRGNG